VPRVTKNSLMSGKGQNRTLKRLHPMSALPPKADIVHDGGNVRFVPKADILRCGEEHRYSITSSALPDQDSGTVTPSGAGVRRRRFVATFIGTPWASADSLWIDVGNPNHFAPFGDFIGDELLKIGRRTT
jgi:hypothetical protein